MTLGLRRSVQSPSSRENATGDGRILDGHAGQTKRSGEIMSRIDGWMTGTHRDLSAGSWNR
jgi:hypothetical protein